jgi:hypothetical protein
MKGFIKTTPDAALRYLVGACFLVMNIYPRYARQAIWR